MRVPTRPSAAELERAAAGLLIAGFAVVLVRTAWLCDDAYLTLRSVDNLLHGFGPRWNVDERVQVYTHPAWMLLLAAANALTSEAYFSTLALGALCSAATIAVVARGTPASGRVVALALLSGSKAFVDFSTSGLENPLTHLLLALFTLECLAERAGAAPRLTLLAALLALSRLDALLLVAPAVCLTLLRAERRWGPIAAAALPALAWEVFAVLYYGSLLPNTAHAKLSTGIPAGELARQGAHYLVNSLRLDPLALPAILMGAASGIASRSPAARGLGAGIALHVAYVVGVGGDFMSGRFLTAPLLMAALLLARLRFRRPVALGLALSVAAAVPARAPWRSSGAYADRERDRGIADERGVYYQATGLLALERPLAPPRHPRIDAGLALRGKGPRVKLVTAAGFNGYYAGPAVHFVDLLGLGDPLLARLPVPREWAWRVGHYERALPAGYLESLRSGENLLADPEIARLYERVRLATQGPLLAPGRLKAIALLNRPD
jgi:arabinofuranosyltransferase